MYIIVLLAFRVKILCVFPIKCSSVTKFLASIGCDDIMKLWKH